MYSWSLLSTTKNFRFFLLLQFEKFGHRRLQLKIFRFFLLSGHFFATPPSVFPINLLIILDFMTLFALENLKSVLLSLG
jgi:hypothetical protein